MFTALIIDDEPDAIGVLRKSLELFCPIFSEIRAARNGQEALEQLQDGAVDLTFLDIRLKREDGLALYPQISKFCQKIVFVTAYDEYAVSAFKTEALHYLLKPIEPEELEKAVERANLTPSRIVLASHEQRVTLDYRDILYLNSDKSYTTFYTVNGEKHIMTKTLKFYEEQLSSPLFYRPHQSYLVNLQYVTRLLSIRKEVALKDGTLIPISKRQLKPFKAAMARFARLT
ncbi:MAG: LytTR family DNA-binding domain-containing protein [Bacteroidota bacterium]